MSQSQAPTAKDDWTNVKIGFFGGGYWHGNELVVSGYDAGPE